jgi:2-polyprenyl-3-methyl-5-hydroxy-6-metoxy-1,4-benzoquinol methylase
MRSPDQSRAMVYESLNQAVLSRVPRTTRRLLDVGCGAGMLGKRIKDEVGCEVVGLTCSEAEAVLAAERLDKVLVCDLNCFDPLEAGRFDCIICSHVLEHLYKPDEVLKRLRPGISAGGTLIVALPNVLYWRQRLDFFRGRFAYTDGGLMDRTHYRFFDWATAKELLEESGYKIIDAGAEGSFPLSRFLPGAGRWMDRAALNNFPGLFGFQFVFVCHPINDCPAV